jgi:hypothetical protein
MGLFGEAPVRFIGSKLHSYTITISLEHMLTCHGEKLTAIADLPSNLLRNVKERLFQLPTEPGKTPSGRWSV